MSFVLDWQLLLVLLGSSFADLFLRWLAFGRIESVALDLAIFTFLYSLVKWVIDDQSDKSRWAARTIICIFVVIVLYAIHSTVYRSELQDQVRTALQRVIDAVPAQNKGVARSLESIILRSVPLSIEISEKNGIRKGKQRIREENVKMLQQVMPLLGLDEATIKAINFKESDLLIARFKRIVLNIAFALLGLFVLLTPVIKFR